MWNWMSAAGSPPRVRVKATTSATVELSLPGPAQQPLGERLRLVGAVQRVRVGTSQISVTKGWSWRLRPTPRQVVARLHAGRAQLVGRADARQQQELRRADRAGGEQHLALGAH